MAQSHHTRLRDLYVGLTRGRDANTAYVVGRAMTPDAPTGQTLTTQERSARAVLGDILAAGRQDRSRVPALVDWGEPFLDRSVESCHVAFSALSLSADHVAPEEEGQMGGDLRGI